MKSGLWNSALAKPIKKSCIKFNNNKLNNLQRYNIAQKYRILYRLVQLLSQPNLRIPYQSHIKKLRQRK
jgi:hypothetical protein